MSDCKYYKCHDIEDKDFDCSLCYCPFYEICKKNENYKIFNGYMLNTNTLACEKCGYFHIKTYVDLYNKLKNENKTLEEIFEYFKNEKLRN